MPGGVCGEEAEKTRKGVGVVESVTNGSTVSLSFGTRLLEGSGGLRRNGRSKKRTKGDAEDGDEGERSVRQWGEELGCSLERTVRDEETVWFACGERETLV